METTASDGKNYKEKEEMSETLQKFVFESANEVNVVVWNEEPWFVGKNVSDILGYQDTEHMVRRLDEDEYKTFNCKDFQNPHFGGIGLEGVKRIILLTESGLYHAIIGSKKPEAKEFRRWVTEEVLPSIRKHGAYMTPQTAQNVLATPENAIVLAKALLDEHEHVQKLESENACLERYCKETSERFVKTKGELETCQQALSSAWKPCPKGKRPIWVHGHWRFVDGEGKTIKYIVEEDKMKKTKTSNKQLKLPSVEMESDDMEKYDSHTCLDNMTKSVVVTEVKDDGK